VSTPLPAALERIAEVLSRTRPPGDRTTLGYRLVEHGAGNDPEDEEEGELEDRDFAFGLPSPIDLDSTSGIEARVRSYDVPVVLLLATADVGSLRRAQLTAEHMAAWERAIVSVATWPQGVHEVVWSEPEPRITDLGDTHIVCRLVVTVWET
jgi:hypothetical protein